VKVELHSDGARWAIDGSIRDWVDHLPVQAAVAVTCHVEDKPELWSASVLEVPGRVVSTWNQTAAVHLGLPPNVPLALDIRLSGAMGKPGAKIEGRWLQPGKSVSARGVSRAGVWLEWQQKTFRVHSPLYEVLELVELFNSAPEQSLEEHFRIWARIREVLGAEASSHITDGFLRALRVVTATALTFGIRQDERGELQIDPVLLIGRSEESDQGIRHERALTEADEALFPKRLDQLREGAPAFPLRDGTYVVVEEALGEALAAVRRLRKAPSEERKRAAMYPEAVLRELLDLGEDRPSVFVETEKFAERVRDVGAWVAPVLPWIREEGLDWGGAASSGVRIDGVDLPLDRPSVAKALEEIRTAIEKGEPSITLAGQTVAATNENANALTALLRAIDRRDQGGGDAASDNKPIPNVLIIENNLDEASFSRVRVAARPGKLGLPLSLRTTPKQHQEAGIKWLQHHWIEGSRGALLCDDMGLGKTYQALAFSVWIKEMMDANLLERRPILLVAPVGLLRNWEAEIADHLFDPGLGNLLRAYGDHLKVIKRGRHVAGTASLDTARLASADVVLANYEAVSDYQLSFGAIRFALIVFDEAQKIKSPSARMTHALKAMNTEFMLGMTGTPVENRLADLWCIADAVQPGALADLKDFSRRYEVEGADVNALRDAIWQQEETIGQQTPRLLLRRLKSEKLDGLPPKHEHVIKLPMPREQMDAYERVLALNEVVGGQGALEMIQGLRRVSLHPALGNTQRPECELQIEQSARFKGMFQVLDQVANTGEKVLVFLESLDLQHVEQLPLLLQRRYGLRSAPMVINGQVSAEARQDRVGRFQRESGFDVMLLSPKAGGVGLTLTAANHVIHLSRWWNPAVEDQCSDRVYRIGQMKPVHIYYPLAVLPGAEERSFDVQLQRLMERKRDLAKNLLAPPAFTKDDVADLLNAVSPH
jgi:superfamily II DNA or RNA helicase